MNRAKFWIGAFLAFALVANPSFSFAASHREAPITAIDRSADIADVYAFVSYDDSSKVTLLLDVDPLLDPANGPHYFPFDPQILYEIKVDNNQDAVEDVVFQFRFTSENRLPNTLPGEGVFVSYVGAGAGLSAPANSSSPVAPGTPIVPPAVTALDGPGSEGLALRQNYTVTRVNYKTDKKGNGKKDAKNTVLNSGATLFAVPSNVGPRTMPSYASLAAQGIYSLPAGVRVFAGTVEDPFWIDLGAAFDSLNFRPSAFPSGVPGVLTDAQEADDTTNWTADNVSGYNVNCLAIEVPISMLTSDGAVHASTDPRSVIGVWGATSRARKTIREVPNPLRGEGEYQQVQRMGNALINELIVGNGSKDRFSMSEPKDDAQFARFFLDPTLARVLNAIYTSALPVPPAPRTDLLPLVTYAAPIAPAGTPAGPVADLLRLNTGVGPTPLVSRKRMGLLAGDAAGYPNGRRVSDDVTDISARAAAGILAGGAFSGFPYNRIGDGVNANDVAYQETFPYVAYAHSGRDSRHVDPGEVGGGPIN